MHRILHISRNKMAYQLFKIRISPYARLNKLIQTPPLTFKEIILHLFVPVIYAL
jgi:hypothetical protein